MKRKNGQKDKVIPEKPQIMWKFLTDQGFRLSFKVSDGGTK